MLLKPPLWACWLTSACAAEPHHYTLTLSTYWQPSCPSLGMFQQTISFHSPSRFPLTSSLFPTDVHKKTRPSGRRLRDFGAGGHFSPVAYQHRLCFSCATAVLPSPSRCLNPDRCNEISLHQADVSAVHRIIEFSPENKTLILTKLLTGLQRRSLTRAVSPEELLTRSSKLRLKYHYE